MVRREIKTLKQFYELMSKTRDIRFDIVNRIFSNKDIKPRHISDLKSALSMIEDIPGKNGKNILYIDKTKRIEVDLTYEIEELKKDIFYIVNGEERFYGYLEKLHPGFSEEVEAGSDKLKGHKFNNFITDRDGTINNYCGRYKSSIQSVYNSIFLTRFARNCVSNSIIITSAPLSDPGILDVSINPEKTFIYAASKAREYVNSNGVRHSYPINREKQDKLNELNRELTGLVKKPGYEKYSLIGSGLQLKFGETTIARQDISGSVPENESLDFLKLIEKMVLKIDPQKKYFHIEDTGYDIEIILTIESSETGSSLKDFDKSDGINFLDRELNLNMNRGPNLICGDTASDLCMLELSVARTKDTRALFVTKDESLAEKVRKVCPDNYIVTQPDILVAILNNLSKKR